MATPTLLSFAYFDDFSLKVSEQVITEAISENILIKDSTDCDKLVTWSNTDDGFDLEYETSGLINKARFCFNMHQFKMTDPEHKITYDSQGQSSRIRSVPEMIHNATIFGLTPKYLEKLMLALKHDQFTVDGIAYVCTTKNFSPLWGQGERELNTVASLSFDLKVADYNFQNSNCS